MSDARRKAHEEQEMRGFAYEAAEAIQHLPIGSSVPEIAEVIASHCDSARPATEPSAELVAEVRKAMEVILRSENCAVPFHMQGTRVAEAILAHLAPRLMSEAAQAVLDRAEQRINYLDENKLLDAHPDLSKATRDYLAKSAPPVERVFVKRPIQVEAVQYRHPNFKSEIVAFCPTAEYVDRSCAFLIQTLEGKLWLNKDDWLVKGIKGEFYPVRDDIFKETYQTTERKP